MSITSRISGTRRLERSAELRMTDTPGGIPAESLSASDGDPVYTSVLAGISRYFGEFFRNHRRVPFSKPL